MLSDDMTEQAAEAVAGEGGSGSRYGSVPGG